MKVGVKKLLRASLMPARTLGVHAVGMSSKERLKLRRLMEAAAGKRVRLSFLCSWTCGLEVEEEHSTQKEFGLENGGTNKKKRGGCKFKKFRRETSPLTCRSGDV